MGFCAGVPATVSETRVQQRRAWIDSIRYAIESNPYYQLLKQHERKVFSVVFADGEEAVVRVLHVDRQHEDFVYDLVSTNVDRDHYRESRDAA